MCVCLMVCFYVCAPSSSLHKPGKLVTISASDTPTGLSYGRQVSKCSGGSRLAHAAPTNISLYSDTNFFDAEIIVRKVKTKETACIWHYCMCLITYLCDWCMQEHAHYEYLCYFSYRSVTIIPRTNLRAAHILHAGVGAAAAAARHNHVASVRVQRERLQEEK